MPRNTLRILVLGGTSDAAALVTQLQLLPVEVISSLAGRTQSPIAPGGTLRVGGFGGVEGLADYLRQQQIDLLIDATHPFAAQISWNAAAAATQAGIARLLLLRPAWDKTDDDRWIEVASHAAAVQILPGLARRIFLTIGRQELAAYAALPDLWFLMRMIDPPPDAAAIPPGELLLARGPFTLAEEQQLLSQFRIEALVSKNSGGEATYAKIVAARRAQLPVVMVARPPLPLGEQVADVDSAIAWVKRYLL